MNIEQIVARLARFGKLGGFHFNDSKYGDDDLDTGSINPHQLFLVFNELVGAPNAPIREGLQPRLHDRPVAQHHRPDRKPVIERRSHIGAFARSEIVDRDALADTREHNDVMAAFRTLRQAYSVDVGPILALVRIEAGGAADPIAAYRESGVARAKTQERKTASSAAGIV